MKAGTQASAGPEQHRSARMKALVYETYGMPEVLRVEEVEIPVPKENEVLIEVHAASVNSWDWDLLRGKPFVNRVGALSKPRYPILGADVSGRVTAVGSAVSRFRPGDEVFGDLSGSGWGGFAEFACARKDALTPKPEGLSFAQAAAIPQAGVLALQGLRDKGRLKKGHKVLINGAGGGVGTLGIQYAKWTGAEVTGVDSAGKLELLRSLGTDDVIDYRQTDFTRTGKKYDVILDVVGSRPLSAIKRALETGGTYVMVGGPMPRILLTMLAGPLSARLHQKELAVLIHKPSHKDQQVWKELAEAGAVVPVIDRQYSLDEAPEALRYLGEGRVRGKVIVNLKPPVIEK
ncbi:NAD(P)-dependent alcohol dehydrogenase [Paenibacillus pinistramenti]|uniref:NAD(P)-dependent alcohol dehydrogenase n=1 Tax=Paenibacillus pinistramenti TaxID=1768003 RepID=UPI001EF00DA6|nr:NAD(P)-dependent alcohol dehydrogenase [Paenibacillus pinistramenti]